MSSLSIWGEFQTEVMFTSITNSAGCLPDVRYNRNIFMMMKIELTKIQKLLNGKN